MAQSNAKPAAGQPRQSGQGIDETDIANQSMGNNQLEGDDQGNVHNERKAQPDARLEADESPVESFEKLDADHRARTELGKGNRSGGREGGR